MNRLEQYLRKSLQDHRNHYSRGTLLFFATLGLCVAAVMTYAWVSADGIPARESLAEASGRVEWMRVGKYGVKFGFDGDDRLFEYLSKANAMDRVVEALRRTDSPLVTVRYQDRNRKGVSYPQDIHRGVFEVAIEGRMIRSHAQVAAAWAADDALSPWLAGFSLICSGFLLLAAVYNPD